MEAAPSAKPRRASPPIPPNYVSLRQLQELRLKEKEEQEKRQWEEAAAEAAVAAAAAKLEAARVAEMNAIAAKVKAEKLAGAASSVAPGRAQERRGGGRGHQWVAVAHQPAALPPTRGEGVAGKRGGATGVGHGKKGLTDAAADAPRSRAKPEGKAKGVVGEEKASSVTSEQTRAADEPGKPAEASSRYSTPKNKGEGKVSEDKSAESGSIVGSGGSADASSRCRKNPKWKKGAGGRSAEPNAGTLPAKTTGASPPQGVNLEAGGRPKPSGPRRAGVGPRSDSSDGKKADASATLAPPTSVAAGSSGGELRAASETKPEGLPEGSAAATGRGRSAVLRTAAETKPEGLAERPAAVVVTRRAGLRPPGDRRNGTADQHGRMWVPKATAAAGCAEL